MPLTGRHAAVHELEWEGTCSCGEEHIYRVTAKGFTDSFNGKQIRTMVDLGLIEHDEDGYDLRDGEGRGIGSLVRTFAKVS